LSKSHSEALVSLIPLGGVGEIGKNMWVVEYKGELLVLDAGVMFPDEDMLGVDLVIPDMTYLIENRERLRGVILSHGHEDHIGSLVYLLKEVPVPVYGTRLTLGLVEGKREEHGLARTTQVVEIAAGQRLKIGPFDLEFIHVNHSLADVVAIALHTEGGAILYATDFKFDHTPIDGRMTDVQKLAELGSKGVLCLLSDSTNAERPGYTLSERSVGETFMQAFRNASGRILVATFASNIHRIQQIFDAAAAHDRKVAVVGRSMVKNVSIAGRLGYLRIPDGLLVEPEELDKLDPRRQVILSTGSQGAPMAALPRVAMAEHRQFEIRRGDTVIISAQPIPGNERMVARTINHLFQLGAEVIYQAVSGVHVSGHACEEELKWMINLVRPKHFVPIHGEYRMLVKHAQIAQTMGIAEDRIVIPRIGERIEVGYDHIRVADAVEAGQVLVDGLGVGDVGNIVLRDRQQLSQDGILIVVLAIDKATGNLVSGPDIVTRGFVYVREAESLIDEARERVRAALSDGNALNGKSVEWNAIKSQVKEALSRHLYEKTKRRPMILPIVMEV